MKVAAFAKSHVGQRENNEDWYRLAADLGLFIIADGVGGYQGGEVASRLAVTSLDDYFRNVVDASAAEDDERRQDEILLRRRSMALAFRIANYVVRRRRKGPYNRMGSTLAALIVRQNQALVGHVGDSRVYRLRQGRLRQLTEDHSLGSTMPDPKTGKPGGAAYAHFITRAIGLSDGATLDVALVDVVPGDRFLLCTDGLHDIVDHETIADILSELPPDIACNTLVDMALYAGGHDNITAIVVETAQPAARQGLWAAAS